MKQLRQPIAWSLASVLFVSCATGKTESSGKGELSSSSGGSNKEETVEVSARRVTVVQSLSNNQLTGRVVNRQKALEQAQRLESAAKTQKDRKVLEALLSADRLSGKSVNDILSGARQVAELDMKKSVEGSLSDEVKLELALAAVQSNKLAMAEFFIDQLAKAKDARVRAGMHNLVGVVAVRQERIPEAVIAFKEALKVAADYRPAQINLGFLALAGGDFALAKKLLGDVQEDWFVQYGFVSIDRLDGSADKASSRCEKVLAKKPNHKPTLFNCGLNELQGNKSYDKATQYLTRATKAPGGSAKWEERAYRLLGQIEEQKAAAESRKAQERIEKDKAGQAKASGSGVGGQTSPKAQDVPAAQGGGAANPPAGSAPPKK